MVKSYASSRPACRRRRPGFTLVDVMIGCTIMTLVAVTMTAAYLSSELAIRRGQNLELATQSARAQLDMWRRQGYTALPAIPNGESSATRSFNPPSTLPHATGQTVFTRVDSNLAPVTSESGRQSVAVTVTWSGAGTDHGSATLTTLMTNSDAS